MAFSFQTQCLQEVLIPCLVFTPFVSSHGEMSQVLSDIKFSKSSPTNIFNQTSHSEILI